MLTFKLNNGVEIPCTGLGVFRLEENGEVEKAVANAIRNGYRMIDTAYAYHNEAGVGRGIKISGVPRSELFITSKVGNEQQGYESTKEAFYQTLKELDTDYLDLYLIHWPQGKKTLETWKAMEELHEEGLIRAIGVSNFKIHHLEYLMATSLVVPALNQVEFHPRHWPVELYEFCRNKGIQMAAWSPLMIGKAVKIPEIIKLADKYKRTPAQIILRWMYQKNIISIPKSSKTHRMIENISIFDFVLAEEDMNVIDALNNNDSLVKYRDKIVWLLHMIWSLKFSKRLYRLLGSAIFDRFSDELKSKPA